MNIGKLEELDELYTVQTFEKAQLRLTPEEFEGFLTANQQIINKIEFINNLNDMNKIQSELENLVKERREFYTFAINNPYF